MGYDYVLDLISEIEIIPGFPVCKSYILVSTDHSVGPGNQRFDVNTWVLYLNLYPIVCFNLVFLK